MAPKPDLERLMPVSELIERLVDIQAPGLREQVRKDQEIKPLLVEYITLLEEAIALHEDRLAAFSRRESERNAEWNAWLSAHYGSGNCAERLDAINDQIAQLEAEGPIDWLTYR